KIIMVDNAFCSIGTANMDYRSFSQNFEVNALIYDPEIASELTYWFLEDLKESEIINLHEWRKRPILDKFKANIARIASPFL
ncbi:MAG: phospholipase D-like domain-containing protein, partial [Salinivirgaceae bacterium]|nr:phospholipase D-like domain-containing protein [Salinivirgaceae bacterium]